MGFLARFGPGPIAQNVNKRSNPGCIASSGSAKLPINVLDKARTFVLASHAGNRTRRHGQPGLHSADSIYLSRDGVIISGSGGLIHSLPRASWPPVTTP
jgi:hypothetical protein